MRAVGLCAAIVALAAGCATPYLTSIQADHGRRFGCEARWVQVRETERGQFRATGCGVASEWSCQARECRMHEHRAYGMGGP